MASITPEVKLSKRLQRSFNVKLHISVYARCFAPSKPGKSAAILDPFLQEIAELFGDGEPESELADDAFGNIQPSEVTKNFAPDGIVSFGVCDCCYTLLKVLLTRPAAMTATQAPAMTGYYV